MSNGLFDWLGGAYGSVDRDVFGGWLPGGAESPRGRASRRPFPQQQTETPTSADTSETGSTATGGASTGTPSGGIDTGGEAGRIGEKRLEDVIQDYLNRKFELAAGQLDPGFQRALSEIALDRYRAQSEIAEQSALRRMREKSARDIQLQNMKSWEAITRAQYQRDADLARGLASTAYIAGTPNANVLSALAGPAQQASSAFKAGSSVF